MTTPTITPYRPGQQAARDGFAQLLRAEWTKFRTVRGWVIGMVVAALVTVGLGLLISIGGSNSCQNSPTAPVLSGAACLPRVPLGPGGQAVTDQFYFVRQPLAGHGSITVRVTSLTAILASGHPGQQGLPGLQPWSKAGIIIEPSTRQGTAYAAMLVTGGHGAQFQFDYRNGDTGLPGAVSPGSPRWLRLTRSGDTITGYDSADGRRWTRVGSARLAGLPPTVQAGLLATSPGYTHRSASLATATAAGGPTLATGVFDHIKLRGDWPDRGWSGTDVGGVPPGFPDAAGGFRQAGGAITVSGSGDIAPSVLGTPVEWTLNGVFAGLIAVAVVGAMVMAAEYKHGLLATTLAASPRRGRVLAAKAIVVGAVTFAAGLAATAVVIPVGEHLLRGHGNFIVPVTGVTLARVMTGTAAMLALTAVLALAAGTVLRRGAAAITVVIMATVLPYLLAAGLPVLPAGVAGWLLRVTPAAGFAVEQTVTQYPQVSQAYTPFNGYYPLAPWAGLAVLAGYAALALAAAAWLLRRRDAA